MRINTHVREENERAANKILRKGRGAWGNFVNGALAAYVRGDTALNDLELKDVKLGDKVNANPPSTPQEKR